MNSTEDKKELDKYEQALEEQLSILKECQQKRNIDSCMKCQELIECKTREEYVKAVYMSMNKGVTGGFEF